jgi:hypothetical protein
MTSKTFLSLAFQRIPNSWAEYLLPEHSAMPFKNLNLQKGEKGDDF